MVYTGRNRNVNVILQHFAIMWILTVVGVLLGMWLPSSVVTPLSLICVMMVILTCFFRSVRLPDIVLYLIPFLTGVMLTWISILFIEILSAELIITVFISTVIIFSLLAVIGIRIPGDLPDKGSLIFAVIFVMIVFSFVFIFFPVENAFLLFLFAIFELVIVMYTVYDFNIIRNNYVRDEDVVYTALNLYLDLINLFANLIEVARRSRR